MNWDEADNDLLRFVQALTKLRRDHPVFRRRRFFWGTAPRRHKKRDIAWFTPSGQHLTDDDWDAGHSMAVAVFLNGDAITEPDARGQRMRDDSFLLLFNASPDEVSFVVPAPPYDGPWKIALDTAMSHRGGAVLTAQPVRVEPHSLYLLRQFR